jgi:hypothetical protein
MHTLRIRAAVTVELVSRLDAQTGGPIRRVRLQG